MCTSSQGVSLVLAGIKKILTVDPEWTERSHDFPSGIVRLVAWCYIPCKYFPY